MCVCLCIAHVAHASMCAFVYSTTTTTVSTQHMCVSCRFNVRACVYNTQIRNTVAQTLRKENENNRLKGNAPVDRSIFALSHIVSIVFFVVVRMHARMHKHIRETLPRMYCAQWFGVRCTYHWVSVCTGVLDTHNDNNNNSNKWMQRQTINMCWFGWNAWDVRASVRAYVRALYNYWINK